MEIVFSISIMPHEAQSHDPPSPSFATVNGGRRLRDTGDRIAVKPMGLIRPVGWRRFFQLLGHLPSFVKLFSRLIRDPRVPAGPKLLVAGILAYVILPIDLLPDFFVGIGQLDDLAVILGGLKTFVSLCPREVVQEHLKAITARR